MDSKRRTEIIIITRTIFQELRHSNRNTERHDREQNHWIFKQAKRRDYKKAGEEAFSGETVAISTQQINKREQEGQKKLTLGSLLIELSPSNRFCLNSDIRSGTRSNKLVRTAIIPRIPTERLPDALHGTVGRDIDPVGRKDVLWRTNVEQIRLGLGREIAKDKGRGARQRSRQDIVAGPG